MNSDSSTARAVPSQVIAGRLLAGGLQKNVDGMRGAINPTAR